MEAIGAYFSVLVGKCPCHSAAQLCPTLCDPMDCSTPGLPVLHHLPEPTQTPVHWVDDAIQLSHPLSPHCSPDLLPSGSFPVSQLFTSGGQSIEASASASVLPVNTQGSFPSGWTGLISLLFKGLSGVFSSTTVQNTDLSVNSGQAKPLRNNAPFIWPFEQQSFV